MSDYQHALCPKQSFLFLAKSIFSVLLFSILTADTCDFQLQVQNYASVLLNPGWHEHGIRLYLSEPRHRDFTPYLVFFSSA